MGAKNKDLEVPEHINQGKFILRARERVNLNQAQFAEKIGFTPQFTGRIEKGFAPLPDNALGSFLDVTGVGLKSFVQAISRDVWARKYKAVNK